MLNIKTKCWALTLLSLYLGIPAYSQSINNSSIIELGQTNKAIGSGFTIAINDVTTEAAIKLACEHFNFTPQIHMPLPQMVSLSLFNASLEETMEAILKNIPADYMVENRNLHVFKTREAWSKHTDKQEENSASNQQTVAEPVITKIVSLSKRMAVDIQKIVKTLNPEINVVHDVPTNSVIIMGPESLVETAENLCKNLDELDVKTQTASSTEMIGNAVKYITQTFELEHADFDEIEEELSTIIERDSSSGSSSSSSNKKDKDGNIIESEYFLLDKARRIAVIHTTKEKFAIIESYFKAINRPLPQVLIEASIVAVDDGLEKQLGIKWNGLEGTTGYTAPQGSNQDPEKRVPFDRVLNYPGNAHPTNDSLKDLFKYGGTWNVSSVQALLKAVETDNKSQILSRPRVTTVTGKTSSIHVGDEIPYTSGTTMSDGGNTTSSVSFKEVGIKLDVTPVVNITDKTIQLNVIPEVSQWVRDVVMGNNTVPQVSTRRAESTIKINDGDTVVIGGLIEAKSVNDVYEVPLLSKIPYIGRAFRSKNTTNTKTNLIILLTARIIDEEHKNTISPKAVEELNEIKPLRDSETIKEISKPITYNSDIYKDTYIWVYPRKHIKKTTTKDTKTKLESNKTNKKDISDSEIYKNSSKLSNKKEMEEYLKLKLQEIRKNNSK